MLHFEELNCDAHEAGARLDGYLTYATAPLLVQACEAYLRSGVRTLNLDVHRLWGVDMLGLRALQVVARHGLIIRLHHPGVFLRALLASHELEGWIPEREGVRRTEGQLRTRARRRETVRCTGA